MPCCFADNVEEVNSAAATRVVGPTIERVPHSLGKDLVHLAFWKLRPQEFSTWMLEQESAWHHEVMRLGPRHSNSISL